MSKPFWRSKTLWFNVVIAAVLALSAAVRAFLGGDGEIDPESLDLPSQLEQFSRWVLIVGNLLLRLITSASLRLGGGDDKSPPPTSGLRVVTPMAALLLLGCIGDVSHAEQHAPEIPEIAVTITEPKRAGERLIVDATATRGDRVEISVWSDGLPDDNRDLREFSDLIEQLRERGAQVIAPPADGEDCHVSRFCVGGDSQDLLVLDSLPGARYVIVVSAFTAAGSASRIYERTVPGKAPDPPGPGPEPEPPGPDPEPDPPGPEPEPEPEPEPDIDDGKFGIARKVYEAARRVNSDNRSDEARRIASVLRSVADDVKGGRTRGSSAIRKSVIDSLDATLSDQESARWSVGFGAVLARIIFDLITSGKLGTWQDWVDLLLEIAAALELLT